MVGTPNCPGHRHLTSTVDGFCIMSSDGDFSRPAVRIREADLRVYGFGRRETVHTFVAACDVFVHLD